MSNTITSLPIQRMAAVPGEDAVVRSAPLKPMGEAAFIDHLVRGQVLPLNDDRRLSTPDQLDRLLDTSAFSDEEMDAVLRSNAEHGGEKDLGKMVIDPGAFERYGAVLMAAIIAMNISRQVAAQLRGEFSIIAAKSAVGQGKAIIEAGHSEMYSAITGAVVAGAMVLGGVTLQLRGMQQKHRDIKTNQSDALHSRNRAKDLQATLDRNGFKDMPSDRVGALNLHQGSNRRSLQLQESGTTLTPDERAKLSEEIHALNRAAEKSGLQSALNEKTWMRNLNIGQALVTMGMVTSAMVASLVRLDVYNQRNQEVLEQTAQMLGKSLSDEEGQRTSEANAVQQKLMEIFTQIMQSRNAAASTIASGMRA